MATNEKKWNKPNAIEFLQTQGFVCLSKGDFNRLNKDWNSLQTNLDKAHEQIAGLVDQNSKGFTRLTNLWAKFQPIFQRWNEFFTVNGGAGFVSEGSSKIAQSSSRLGNRATAFA